MDQSIIEEQKQYEASMMGHKRRLEAKARLLYEIAKARKSKITYEEIWSYVVDDDTSDYGCEPSPIEWERICNGSKG